MIVSELDIDRVSICESVVERYREREIYIFRDIDIYIYRVG